MKKPMLRIFISYSWQNMTYREALISILTSEGYKPVSDQAYVPPGDKLNEGIINMLNSSNAVIACLTKDSVDSKAVLEELTRAHHQSLKIYSVVHCSVTSSLPWFVQNTVYLPYETEEQLIFAFRRLVCEVIKKDRELIEAGKIHNIIQKQHGHAARIITRDKFEKPEGRWLHKSANAILENVSDELSSLSTSHYRAIVGEGANFLTRAKAVFEKASQVYAVSIDKVSSFWVSDQTYDQQLASTYLRTQPENTMRLFVFSSPNSTHNYVNVLNSHAKKYGMEGRVFICSEPAYKRIVRDCVTRIDDHDLFDCDFAVLEYRNSTTDNVRVYEATLDREFFKVTRVTDRELPGLKADEIRKIFNELRHLNPGQIHSFYRVMRWEIGLQKRKENWAAKLQELFPHRDRDLLHFVFFDKQALHSDIAESKLRECVRNIQRAVGNASKLEDNVIYLKDVWFGKSEVVHAWDRRTGDRLINDAALGFPYVLFMRFENFRSLKEWYELPEHFDIRRSLFEMFDPSLNELFAEIDQESFEPNDVTRALYERIEAHAISYMKRMDYSDTDTIRDIVDKDSFRSKIDGEYL